MESKKDADQEAFSFMAIGEDDISKVKASGGPVTSGWPPQQYIDGKWRYLEPKPGRR